MAFLQSIKNLFWVGGAVEPAKVVPAERTNYFIRPVRAGDLLEIANVNLRCFRKGENYSKSTFNYLLNEPRSVAYKTETDKGRIAGFVFVLLNEDGAAHITTLGVAPEHRRRGIARRMLVHLDTALKMKGISTVVLEVRVSNFHAQELYLGAGYAVAQRVERYYSNGEDGYLMIKSLV